jgi:hypothetical protein
MLFLIRAAQRYNFGRYFATKIRKGTLYLVALY